MEGEKKLETLENELKLMKGELKQSLASVRDYLLNMELPSSEFSTILAALGDGGDQKVTMKGNFSDDRDKDRGKTAEEETEDLPSDGSQEESLESESGLPGGEEMSGPEDSLETGPEESLETGPEDSLGSGSDMLPEDELSSSQDENLGNEEQPLTDEDEGEGEGETTGEENGAPVPESELPAEEERQMSYDKMVAEVNPSIPKVNLMANLIGWVSKAKKEIGYEQIPTFLDVYGISGHLSPDMKETILHLAEITSDQPETTNTSEVWSQSMLSLHGILTGNDAPLYAPKPSWNGGNGESQVTEEKVTEAEPEKPKRMPLKLKLVFPNGDGKDKEFCLDLTPEGEDKDS